MLTVEKKQRRTSARRRPLLLLTGVILMLTALLTAIHVLDRVKPSTSLSPVSSVETLFSYPAADVSALTIHRNGEDPWSIRLDSATKRMQLTGENGFLLSADTTAALQQAAATITCEQIISDDPAEYTGHLADFGLDSPSTASISFTDGTTRTLRIGKRAAHTAAWYYMTIDGDARLYALSTGMVEALLVSRESLKDVTQPIIHKSRINRITLRGSDSSIQAEWTLRGLVGADDAGERWQITAPFSYPADASAMSTLLSNAENLRLGAYIAPATAENLTSYGFDTPRMTIELHMAAGTVGTTNADGAFTTADWSESTVFLVVGGQRSDMVDYVCYEDGIYVSSHFTTGVFLDADPRSSMTRYPVLTALGNLASLTIEKDGAVTTYILAKTERVAPNNDLVYDEAGNLLWDVTVSCNGESFDYAAFESAYTRLSTVSVAGVLPEGDPVDSVPHTIYTFTDVDGTVHTVALASYGVLHDAVSIDGYQAFYIEKNRFRLELE